MKYLLLLTLLFTGCKQHQSEYSSGPGVDLGSFDQFISGLREKPNWLLDGQCSGQTDSIRNEYQRELDYTLKSDGDDFPQGIEHNMLDQVPRFFAPHLKANTQWIMRDQSRQIGTYIYNNRDGVIDVSCMKTDQKTLKISIVFNER